MTRDKIKNKMDSALEKFLDFHIGKVDSLDTLSGYKNPCYIIESNNEKFFVKKLKEKNLNKELFGLTYFSNFLNLNVPHINNFEKGFLILNYQENLENISAEEFILTVLDYQNKYDSLSIKEKNLAKGLSGFPRKEIDRDFNKNITLFEDYDTKKILNYISEFNQNSYSFMERIISHGDVRKGNFFKNNNNPFILDFEKVCLEYPTFDISTLVYSLAEEKDEIIDLYLIEKKEDFYKNKIKNLILADSLRIALFDTIFSYKKGTNEERKECNRKVIENIFS